MIPHIIWSNNKTLYNFTQLLSTLYAFDKTVSNSNTTSYNGGLPWRQTAASFDIQKTFVKHFQKTNRGFYSTLTIL